MKYVQHPFDQDESLNGYKVHGDFISYSNEDYEWARWQLEGQGYTITNRFQCSISLNTNIAYLINFDSTFMLKVESE